MKTSTIYIYFNGECENAFNRYREVFQTELLSLIRYRDVPWQENIPCVPKDYLHKIENVAIQITKNMVLMGCDMIAPERKNEAMKYNFSIYLEAQTKQQAERVFNGLSENGTVTTPMSVAHWGDLFGKCTDKFGVNWMINYHKS